MLCESWDDLEYIQKVLQPANVKSIPPIQFIIMEDLYTYMNKEKIAKSMEVKKSIEFMNLIKEI